MADFGPVCEECHDTHVRNIQTERVQADEIWAFCYAKDKNLPALMRGRLGVGSVWTWTALYSNSKLMISWMVGDRDAECAGRFMRDLSHRLANRCQLTTGGHGVYKRAVVDAFGWNIDYAQLVEIYGPSRETEARYSPCDCLDAKAMSAIGLPVAEDISTSHVERQNVKTRDGMRRFPRLTNGFSKKLAIHRAAVAIHFMHYNFARIHKALHVTPAIESSLANHVWTLEQMVTLMEKAETAGVGTDANKRGPYQKWITRSGNIWQRAGSPNFSPR